MHLVSLTIWKANGIMYAHSRLRSGIPYFTLEQITEIASWYDETYEVEGFHNLDYDNSDFLVLTFASML